MPHPPQTLIPSSGRTTPSAQLAPPARPAWCLTPRKPLFLRPEAPRPQPKQRRRRDRRGASSPANPYSFVRKHHALSPNSAAGGVSVVPHTPQILIPSSGSTTPSTHMAPPAGTAWCLTLRKPLFLRPEAPRPQLNWLRRRDRRGASHPANPYSFVRKHHAPEANSAAGANGVVPHPPQTLIPSSGGTTPSGQMTPPAGGAPTASSAPKDRAGPRSGSSADAAGTIRGK